MCVQFERPIRNSPLLLRVTDHINPLRRIGRAPSRALDETQAGFGGGGGDEVELVQPAAIAISSKTNTVFVLDTGAHWCYIVHRYTLHWRRSRAPPRASGSLAGAVAAIHEHCTGALLEADAHTVRTVNLLAHSRPPPAARIDHALQLLLLTPENQSIC